MSSGVTLRNELSAAQSLSSSKPQQAGATTQPSAPSSSNSSSAIPVIVGNAAAESNATAKAPSEEQLAKVEKAFNDLNETMRLFDRALRFSVHKESGKTIVEVVDTESKKVIKTIPSEEMLRVADRIQQAMGLLVDTTG